MIINASAADHNCGNLHSSQNGQWHVTLVTISNFHNVTSLSQVQWKFPFDTIFDSSIISVIIHKLGHLF